MLKAKLQINNPDELEATITFTMKLREWKELREQLDRTYPSWKVSGAIRDLIVKSESYYTIEEQS